MKYRHLISSVNAYKDAYKRVKELCQNSEWNECQREKDIAEHWKRQTYYNLIHHYRLLIANGNLQGGDAKYMRDIEVTLTPNFGCRVFYKGSLIGVYPPTKRAFEKLQNVRSMLNAIVEQDWFQEKLKNLKTPE